MDFYRTSPVANQIICSNNQAVVMYATEKWWNYWTMKDVEDIRQKMAVEEWRAPVRDNGAPFPSHVVPMKWSFQTQIEKSFHGPLINDSDNHCMTSSVQKIHVEQSMDEDKTFETNKDWRWEDNLLMILRAELELQQNASTVFAKPPAPRARAMELMKRL